MMFEISGQDIATLGDADLRTLVARLCAIELRSHGLPASAVTAGGHQDAPDGGLDVRVQLPTGSPPTDFIPRPETGFQVKVPDMGPAKISREMRPGGVLRAVIGELANASGAYIIVCSSGSVADRSLQKRRKAMTEAGSSPSLHLDFYDRERLAQWTNLYPSVVAWVRERLGTSFQGWQPYANWSAPNEPLDAPYLQDETSCVHENGKLLTAEQGIERLREELSKEKGMVRLVGLSGLGKTRLAQVLFDPRVGTNALPDDEAVYTDLGHQPVPSPRELVQQLVHGKRRAIVVVDNCPPDTHRDLVRAALAPDSRISLLTVEYDVADDTPEETQVFKLEAASDAVIEKLIERRLPQISQVDRGAIAHFSSGNARVALALAGTVKQGESLGGLRDTELFRRLFHQKNQEDNTLLRAALACSLVYSFNGETKDGDGAELPVLASLAGMTVSELKRHIVTLLRRDLVQKRRCWRAVLPHALANRLANQALEEFFLDDITGAFRQGPERLFKSFSRRLGYLHDSAEAQELVSSWFEEGGMLAKLSLTPLGFSVLSNVAPVVPTVVLGFLTRQLAGPNRDIVMNLRHPDRPQIARLCRSLAYDADSFDAAATLVAELLAAEPTEHTHNSSKKLFGELFHIYLSGTHALIDQRIRFADLLLSHSDRRKRELGFLAYDALMKADYFTSLHPFEFGAHPRDYGWQPRNSEEYSNWFRAVISASLRHITEKGPCATRMSSLLASNFRSLWLYGRVFDELDAMAKAIAANKGWNDGWIAVRGVLGLDGAKMSEDLRRRLRTLAETLRPQTLVDEVRAYLQSGNHHIYWDLELDPEEPQDDSVDKRRRRIDEHVISLGRRTAADSSALFELLPELVSGKDNEWWWSFGSGLADGEGEIGQVWNAMHQALTAPSKENRNLQVIRGYLSRMAAIHPHVAEQILDQALEDPVLQPWLPALQCAVPISEAGADRLITAVRRDDAPVWPFRNLIFWGATRPISSNQLTSFLDVLAERPDGMEVAIDIMRMKFHTFEGTDQKPDATLIACGRRLLAKVQFSEIASRADYNLSGLVDVCLAQEDAVDLTYSICRKLADMMDDYSLHFGNAGYLINSLIKAQLQTALDCFLLSPAGEPKRSSLRNFGRNTPVHPFADVPIEALIAWAGINPVSRFPALAHVIPPFIQNGAEETSSWSPSALGLLEAATNKVAVLDVFAERFAPSSWWGSLAPILDKRREAVEQLASHPDLAVREWARDWSCKLKEWGDAERQRDRNADESFE